MISIFLNRDRKLRNLWWVGIFFVLLFAIVFPLIVLSQEYHFKISLTAMAAIVFTVTVLCQWMRRKPVGEVTGRLNFRWLTDFGKGAVIGSLLMLVPAAILTAFGAVSWTIGNGMTDTLPDGLALFAAVAVGEELLSRGFIFQRMVKGVGVWPAQFVIAGLFLLTHLGNPGMTGVTLVLASVNIFIASLLFGFAYLRTNSLAMPIGLHLFANFVQGTVLGFGVSGSEQKSILVPVPADVPVWLHGGAFGLEASVLCLVVLIVITSMVYRLQMTERTN